MQVGSLVNCVKAISPFHGWEGIQKDTILVIRNVSALGVRSFLEFEEVPTPIKLKDGYTIHGFNPDNFRELLPPEEVSIESILESELVY